MGFPVAPIDPATGTAPVGLTFSGVSQNGITFVSTSSAGPPAPAGFQLGTPPTYSEIETTAQYSGSITIGISYAGMTFGDEAALRLFHGLAGGTWEDVTTSLDIANDVICGGVTSLSPFILAEATNRPPIAEAGLGQVIEASSPSGAAVTLDGSGSHDPDGDALSYTWYGPFGARSGAVTMVSLPMGDHAVTLAVSDGKGGTATDTVTITAQDTTAPAITISAPQEGVIYLLNQAVTAGYACGDSASGVATCSGIVASGSWLDTATVGPKIFTVSATDVAGNAATRTVTYRVLYRFTGFLAPVDNPPILNVANSGRTIPVKWKLADAGAAANSALASFSLLQSAQVGCDASPTDTIPDSATTLAGESLQYDAAAAQFIYNWRTNKNWAGTCRQIWLTLADGTVHSGRFNLK